MAYPSSVLAMENPPICSGSLCKLCHGDYKTEFEKKAHDSPSFARPTIANIRRNIANRLSSPKKPVAAPPPSKSRLSFLDLPPEVRLQIYRDCLVDATKKIAGWTKGGGIHADQPIPTYAFRWRLWITASHKFPRKLLTLNKFIYNEAVRELYMNIAFSFAAYNLDVHLEQIKYWLMEHPLRFSTRLELPAMLLVAKSTNVYSWPRITKSVSVEALLKLNQLLSRLPNLLHLNINLIIDVNDSFFGTEVETLLEHASKKSTWKICLAAMVSKLPKKCKSILVIKTTHPYHTWNSHNPDALAVLRIEKGFVEQASALGKFSEVRHLDAKHDRPTRVGTATCVILQKMHVRIAS